MDHIGLDLHKRDSQVCILTEMGEVIERRIRTDATRLAALLGPRPRARILLEASTESEWVAQCLEALDHEVIVADPSYAPMYAARSRHIKTDRRDARTLAEACRLGAYRPAHRLSAAARHLRAELVVREALVRTRTRYATLVRTLLRRDGLRLPSGQAEHLGTRLTTLEVPERLRAELAPVLALLAPLQREIHAADRRLAALATADPVVPRLQSVPGVGPVTAVAFVAVLDEVGRFASAHQLTAYLGLVPREHSSGERQHRGAITKAGNRRMRWLLVEAAWNILRSRQGSTARAAAVDGGRGGPARLTHRGRGAGAPAGGDSLRDVARRHTLWGAPRGVGEGGAGRVRRVGPGTSVGRR